MRFAIFILVISSITACSRTSSSSINGVRAFSVESKIENNSFFPYLELNQGEEIWESVSKSRKDGKIYGKVILQDSEFEMSGILDTFSFAFMPGVGTFLLGEYPAKTIFYLDTSFNPVAQITILETSMNCTARLFRFDGEKFHICNPICLPFFLIDPAKISYEDIDELLKNIDSYSYLMEWYAYPDCNTYIFRRFSGSC